MFDIRRSTRWLIATTAAAIVSTAALAPSGAEGSTGTARSLTGTLADGATYRIEVPEHWNGTLAVYGHGLRFPGQPNPAEVSYDPRVTSSLLASGFALAGSSYARTGWALPEALRDQADTVAAFRRRVGTPARVLAWGESLGAAVALGLVERREDVDAALPMCGPLAGSVALWNSYLDGAFVIKTLLQPAGGPQLTHIANPVENAAAATRLVAAAAGSRKGRARLALAAAVMQLPGREDPGAARPAPGDVAARTAARIAWLQNSYVLLAFGERGEMEIRAGGNPSSNEVVDYAEELRLSRQTPDVGALYAQAGLSLKADLATLHGSARVHADPAAVRYLQANVGFTGRPHGPVLTLHNIDDGLLPTSHERAYRTKAYRRGSGSLLRQTTVDRAGHCLFTSAEVVTAMRVLERRMRTAAWPALTPRRLNDAATNLGPALNVGGGRPVRPAFTAHHPLAFPRPVSPPRNAGPGARLGS